AVAYATAPFQFDVKCLMFDVDGAKLKKIASNVKHQTSNFKKNVSQQMVQPCFGQDNVFFV
ncbi:hypothetical protein, partial [uncultured Megasphaera sp.]|uniref:hypothetical protein n=1 Tax=uncultured Megasphaera sp. TaxID=165188 RepID=UPI0025D3ABE3